MTSTKQKQSGTYRDVTNSALELLREAETHFDSARSLVGLSLRARREALDLSIHQVARLAGGDASEISKIERGRRWTRTSVDKVHAVLTALELERAGVGQVHGARV